MHTEARSADGLETALRLCAQSLLATGSYASVRSALAAVLARPGDELADASIPLAVVMWEASVGEHDIGAADQWFAALASVPRGGLGATASLAIARCVLQNDMASSRSTIGTELLREQIAGVVDRRTTRRSVGLGLELACATRTLGLAYRRLHRSSTSESLLRSAASLFDECSQPLWSAIALREASVLLRRGSSVALSPREHQITSMAADGLTNQDIAARVHVSVKTVEAVLTRAYQKLGISRRAQLHAATNRHVGVLPYSERTERGPALNTLAT
jgi:DNA-binding CsgD family transcriptional regulator